MLRKLGQFGFDIEHFVQHKLHIAQRRSVLRHEISLLGVGIRCGSRAQWLGCEADDSQCTHAPGPALSLSQCRTAYHA